MNTNQKINYLTSVNIQYTGNGEYQILFGSKNIGSIHLVHGMYYPMINFTAGRFRVNRFGNAKKTIIDAKEWVFHELKLTAKQEAGK